MRNFNGGKKEVDLPALYTRNIMPCNRSHIPTNKTARRWSHLQRIKDRLPPLKDCDVGLLIGYNCTDALVPLEVIPSQNNGPFAQKTLLGWGIVGTIDMSVNDEDVFGCSHRVVAESVNLDNKAPMGLVLKSKEVEEVLAPEQVPVALEQDVANSKNQGGRELSKNEKFQEVLESNITRLKNKHYQMPLPFKGNSNQLERNKTVANSRLNQLKIRFAKDAKYRSDNVEFMNDMFKMGVAKPVPEQKIDEKEAWYRLHNSVHHPPRKKMREVFDCLSRCNGVSVTDMKCATSIKDLQPMEKSGKPTDYASRGYSAADLIANELWLQGPNFLSSLDVYFQSRKGNDAAFWVQDGDREKKSPDRSSDADAYFKSRNFALQSDDPGVKMHAVVTEQCLDLSRAPRASG